MSAEENGGRVIQGAAQVHRITHHPPALELSRKMTNYLRRHGKYFDEDGHFIEGPERLRDFGGPHFHAHTIALLSMLEYALAANDRDTLEFVRRSYEWAKTQGNETIGFFPENMTPDYKSVETCEVADMIGISADEVNDNLKISTLHVSINAPFVQGEENSLLDVLAEQSEESPDTGLLKDSLRKEVRRALATLTVREAEVIGSYFGLEGNASMTLEEIGDKLNLTRERVRQIKEKALNRLRHVSRARALQSFTA